MNEVDTNDHRAVGLTTLGNPITLIASLDRLSKLCPQYKLYICLNPQREYISNEQFDYIVNSSYKIIQSYERLFKEIVVIEAHYKAWWGTLLWATHGFCMDVLLTLSQEPHMVVFEEDAFVFDKDLFYSWFDKLNQVHIVCGMNNITPNNFDVFDRLKVFPYVPDVDGPGKESVMFFNKSIQEHWDWWSVDYMKFEKDIKFTPPFDCPQLTFRREVNFDTFEFFSMVCYLHPQIKLEFYQENSYADYWRYQGMNKLHEFYNKHNNIDQYIHYFNTALFQYLEHNEQDNRERYERLLFASQDHGHYAHHLSTYILGLAFIKTFKQKYIDILGIEQYIKHRKSLKNYVYLLVKYYGYERVKSEFNMNKYIRFTYSYVRKHHTLN